MQQWYVSICKLLGMHQKTIDIFEEELLQEKERATAWRGGAVAQPRRLSKGGFGISGDAPPVPWHRRLSHNELRKVNLVRALVYNPEVLVVQRPADGLDEHDAKLTLQALRDFVDYRGVGLDRALAKRRRPRTVFLSLGVHAAADHVTDISDVIWEIQRDADVKDRVFCKTGGHPFEVRPPSSSAGIAAAKPETGSSGIDAKLEAARREDG